MPSGAVQALPVVSAGRWGWGRSGRADLNRGMSTGTAGACQQGQQGCERAVSSILGAGVVMPSLMAQQHLMLHLCWGLRQCCLKR